MLPAQRQPESKLSSSPPINVDRSNRYLAVFLGYRTAPQPRLRNSWYRNLKQSFTTPSTSTNHHLALALAYRRSPLPPSRTQPSSTASKVTPAQQRRLLSRLLRSDQQPGLSVRSIQKRARGPSSGFRVCRGLSIGTWAVNAAGPLGPPVGRETGMPGLR